jgi:type I restriction enzyme M protein
VLRLKACQVINFREKASFIWSIAELLRGDYKQADYGKVILPLTILRRFDCVLESTKPQVLEKAKTAKAMTQQAAEQVLNAVAGQKFHNTSKYDFKALKDDPVHIAANLKNYIHGFSTNAREILEYFDFLPHIERMDDANILYQIISRFCDNLDLHPDKVNNIEMGYIFEELIRKFAEQSNETAGEHFTPREVIRLMVNLLFIEDDNLLKKQGIIKTLYDPACGTGGMLSVAEEHLTDPEQGLNPEAKLEVFGQELNPESYAICKADMLIKGQNAANIKFGNSFTLDGFRDQKFDYMLSNPPFGVDWKKVEKDIKKESDELGFDGRFGAGTPRVNDGSFLFLQHMLSKMKPLSLGGSRLGIVFNGSPLFTGGADSGESNIRKWIIENDWLEAIIALPEQLFYNTGIYTYIWILTNRKPENRKGRIQLIDARSLYDKMRKSLGNKRNRVPSGIGNDGNPDGSPDHVSLITQIYGQFEANEYSKIFRNEDFGFSRITVERPLRLRFEVTPERLDAFKGHKAFTAMAVLKSKATEKKEIEIAKAQAEQDDIVYALKTLLNQDFKTLQDFEAKLDKELKRRDAKPSATVRKAITDFFSERDENAPSVSGKDGKPVPDADLRDYENVPLTEDIQVYFKREVLPHVPDAWIDESKTKVGYEIPLTRHFYQYQPLRPLEEIDAEIQALEQEISQMLARVTA